ncbi:MULTISPECIES: dimethyl sulfoxide reductase anchor subunit family protein [Providencia]|uniref:dimethyl sulfoxide reductase anchor subunit family protein n=1 Tax=Providencia TaxID=586 RepID=UPI00140BEFA4|nr:DmsC/YnfH family molybdoenzyme membrane anchor subunit [Providencia sp. M-27]
MHELPLVFFTVLGQSAAGLYLLAYASRRLGMLSENQLRHANIAAFVIMIIALVIGGLHVGQPLRFFNMLLGVGRSPMSNEALLSGIFVAFGAATLLFTLFIKNKVLSELCNVATVIFGLAFVWSIPQVYNIATVANWFTVFTTLQMWMTLLVAGGTLAILFGAQRLGAMAFLIGSIMIFATRAAYVSFLGETGPGISAEQAGFWSFQLVVLAVMLFVYPALLYRGRNSFALLGLCALAVILAELSGRIAFYNLWQITM